MTQVRKSRISLQTKSIITVAIMVTAITALSSFISIRQTLINRESDLAEELSLIAKLQSSAVAPPLWNFEHEQVKKMLLGLKENASFHSVLVADDKGKEIASLGDDPAGNDQLLVQEQPIVLQEDGDEQTIGSMVLRFSKAEIKKELTETIYFGLASGAILLLVILASIALVLRMIFKPLNTITSAMSELAVGNLETEIPATERKDDIGDMARAVQVFKDAAIEKEQLEKTSKETERRNQEERVKEFKQLSNEFEKSVGNMVAEIEKVSKEMHSTADGMIDTAKHADERINIVGTTSSNAMSNVQAVASAAEQLTASINEISGQVSQSSVAANEAVSQTEEANREIEALLVAANEIGQAIELIEDIADQTNLLALNATIEAARAGDSGKGFAVVASEVKSLAGQTAKVTEEIRQQINGVQGATNSSVSAIRRIGERINKLNENTTAIASAIEEQGAATKEISRNIDQAAENTEEVNQHILDVGEASNKTGRSSQEVMEVTEALGTKIISMRNQVGDFIQRLSV